MATCTNHAIQVLCRLSVEGNRRFRDDLESESVENKLFDSWIIVGDAIRRNGNCLRNERTGINVRGSIRALDKPFPTLHVNRESTSSYVEGILATEVARYRYAGGAEGELRSVTQERGPVIPSHEEPTNERQNRQPDE